MARTKHLAKIASQVAKPDGLKVVDPDAELDFLHDLPVELMWGVGPVTKAKLADMGAQTIAQLARMSGWSLEKVARIVERNRPEPSQRSARNPPKSESFGPRYAIWPTGLPPASGRNAVLEGR